MQTSHAIIQPDAEDATARCGPGTTDAAENQQGSQSTRAVLLTHVHSPARADEAARVLAAGGTIATTPGIFHPCPDCHELPLPKRKITVCQPSVAAAG